MLQAFEEVRLDDVRLKVNDEEAETTTKRKK